MKLRNPKALASILLVVSIVLTVGVVASATEANLGVVNMQQVLSSHPGLESAQLEYQQAAEGFQQELANLDEEQQQALLPQYQQELQNMEREIQQKLLVDIEAAIEAVANELGLTMVVDESAVLYGGQDITALVIENLQ